MKRYLDFFKPYFIMLSLNFSVIQMILFFYIFCSCVHKMSIQIQTGSRTVEFIYLHLMSTSEEQNGKGKYK